MQKTKSNGQVGPAIPAPTPPPAGPAPPAVAPDPFDQIRVLVMKAGNKRYADGFRRAMTIIARAVGPLDQEAKDKLSKSLDQLEAELHQAELSAL